MPAHPILSAAVDAGIIRPIRALDETGREVTVFIPTAIGQQWFGPEGRDVTLPEISWSSSQPARSRRLTLVKS